MCIHYFGIFTGTNLSIDVKSLTLVLVIVCKKMCAILLPTISEGGIDFTIRRVEAKPRREGWRMVKSMPPERMVGNCIILQFTKWRKFVKIMFREKFREITHRVVFSMPLFNTYRSAIFYVNLTEKLLYLVLHQKYHFCFI